LTRPDLNPIVFAPGLISTDEHEFSCTFSADGKEFYFNRNKNIYFTVQTDTGWTEPQETNFNSNYLDNEAYITLDNQYLFFGSKRPHAGNGFTNDYGIWVCERKNNYWNHPKYVGPAAYISASKSGHIYTRKIIPEYRKGEIVKTTLKDYKFSEMIPQEGGLKIPANGFLQGMHPCISADENFIIFDAMYEAWGNSPELFICFKEGENKWSRAYNLSNVISLKNVFCPYISPDGKYLFFSINSDIYWVSIKIIDKIKAT
jgi:hypothetical protein